MYNIRKVKLGLGMVNLRSAIEWASKHGASAKPLLFHLLQNRTLTSHHRTFQTPRTQWYSWPLVVPWHLQNISTRLPERTTYGSLEPNKVDRCPILTGRRRFSRQCREASSSIVMIIRISRRQWLCLRCKATALRGPWDLSHSFVSILVHEQHEK